MNPLYQGAHSIRLVSQARASRRTRVLFVALATLAALLLSASKAASPDVVLWGAAVCGSWLALSLAWGWVQRRAQAKGRLAFAMGLGYSMDLLASAFLVWRFGASQWLAALALVTVLAVAGLYLPRRPLLMVIISAAVALVFLLLCPWVPALSPPAGTPYPAMLTGFSSWVADLLVVGLMSLFSLAVWRSASAAVAREADLQRVNQRLRSLNDALHDQQFSLMVGQQDLLMVNERLRQKNEEVLKSQDVIQVLAQALEARDPYTQGHSLRVAEVAVLLAREMGLGREEQEAVRHGCLLHDIGKIHVPDAVLRKAGSLDETEFELMRRHPAVGEQICRSLAFARPFLAVIRHHHERWDGMGYPDGLAGVEISLHARITAVADAWDAMTTDRPYRVALPLDIALQRLTDGAGTQWDPDLIELFVRVMTRRLGQAPVMPEYGVSEPAA